MSGYLNQDEKTNNIAFIALFLLYLICLFLQSGIVILFITIGAVFYGFFTKNKIKSFIFGFLLPFMFCFYALFFSGIEELLRVFPFYFLLSLFAGFSGVFAAAIPKDRTQQIIYFLISIFFAFIIAVLFFSGLN